MTDDELERQWRAQSAELPSARLDAAIRTAARQALRRRPPWQRYAPLAAAASVGVIAFLLVRQAPNPVPAVDVRVAAEAHKATPTQVPVAETPSTPVVAEVEATEAHAKRSLAVTREREQQAAATAQVPAQTPAHVQVDAPPQMRASADTPAPAAAARMAPSSLSRAEAIADQAIAALPPPIEALVKADAAQRAGIDADQVVIVAVEAVTWADAALGCRRPGELAIQMLTPGYRVDLEAAGKRLVYHADSHAQIRVCESHALPDAP